MNRVVLKAFLVVCVVCVGGLSAARADVEPERWRQIAAITVEAPPAEAKGLVEVSLSPEALDLVRSSLADIRIADAEHAEVPYVLFRTRHPAKSVSRLSATLINRTFLPARSSTVTADFGRKFLKDRVQVKTAGQDFRREVLVESSDDGRSWQVVRRGGLLFRVGKAGHILYEKDEVTFSVNDHQYLRITVFNGPDDKTPISIDAVEAPSVVADQAPPARTEPVNIRGTTVTEEKEKRRTVIEFDLGFRHLPLDKLKLAFADRNFFRRAHLEGRDEETRVIRHPREDGDMAEETVEAPWRSVKSLVLFRYTAGGGEDSSLSIPMGETGYRYLRLTIENEDNPPLTFREATLNRFLQLVRFPFAPGRERRLYLGNAYVGAPRYDLRYYVSRLEKEGVVPGTLGLVAANPVFSADEEMPPWSERHPVILWGALIAIGAVLAVLILRQVRAIQAHQAAKDSE